MYTMDLSSTTAPHFLQGALRISRASLSDSNHYISTCVLSGHAENWKGKVKIDDDFGAATMQESLYHKTYYQSVITRHAYMLRAESYGHL